MKTPAELIVESAFRIYPHDQAKLKEYISRRIQQYLDRQFDQAVDSDVEAILLYVCDIFAANPSTIKTKLKKTEHAEARFVMFNIMRNIMKMNLNKIGLFFGGRDHSTVLHGISKYEEYCKWDKQFARKASFCMDYAYKILMPDEPTQPTIPETEG